MLIIYNFQFDIAPAYPTYPGNNWNTKILFFTKVDIFTVFYLNCTAPAYKKPEYAPPSYKPSYPKYA